MASEAIIAAHTAQCVNLLTAWLAQLLLLLTQLSSLSVYLLAAWLAKLLLLRTQLNESIG